MRVPEMPACSRRAMLPLWGFLIIGLAAFAGLLLYVIFCDRF
ncbi:MAG TPA: hypothetical protein VHE37_03365 [Nevskiaceae bacterium]|nr:hypothetical protein [Nevskiaceae bacterium]